MGLCKAEIPLSKACNHLTTKVFTPPCLVYSSLNAIFLLFKFFFFNFYISKHLSYFIHSPSLFDLLFLTPHASLSNYPTAGHTLPFLMVASFSGPLPSSSASKPCILYSYNSLLSHLTSVNRKIIVLENRKTIFLNQLFITDLSHFFE